MDIRTYIEMGEKRAGKQIELAKTLKVRDTAIRLAKSGKQGLPDAVCIQLANYIEVDPLEVIAASNLVTEKDEERRKIFEGCFKRSKERATAMIIGGLVISILTMVPETPANAGVQNNNLNKIYIIRNRRQKQRRMSDYLAAFFDSLRDFFWQTRFAG